MVETSPADGSSDIGIEVDSTHKWNINAKWTHIEDIENLAQLVRGKTRDRMWQQLSKQRHNYQGLGTGRDEEASEALGKITSPLRSNRWKMIQADGIFTTMEGLPEERDYPEL